MTKTIYRYRLEITDKQVVPMPKGSVILSAQTKGETISLWVLCNPTEIKVPRYFEIYGTGMNLEGKRKYIATCQIGEMVWHLFERI